MADPSLTTSPPLQPTQPPGRRNRKKLRTVSVHHTRLSPATRTPPAESALRYFVDDSGRVTETGDHPGPQTPMPCSNYSNAAQSAGLPIMTLNGTIKGHDTRRSNATNDQAATPRLPLEPGVESLSTAVPFGPRAHEGFPTISVKNSASQIENTTRPSSTADRPGASTPQLLRLEPRCPIQGFTYTFDPAGTTALPETRMIVYSNKSGHDLLREIKRPANYIDQVTEQRTPPRKSARYIHRHDSGAQGLVMPSPTLNSASRPARRQST